MRHLVCCIIIYDSYAAAQHNSVRILLRICNFGKITLKYRMLYIYMDDDVPWWLDQTEISYQRTMDEQEWAHAPGPRVAVLVAWGFEDHRRELVARCCDRADLVILIFPEFTSDQWCWEFDRSNVIMLLGGALEQPPRQARIGYCMYFFWYITNFYSRHPDLLQGLDTEHKPRAFDVLLGRRKHHRDLIYQGIDRNVNLVTYFPQRGEQDIRGLDQQGFIWPDDLVPKPSDAITLTAREVCYQGDWVSLSLLIPRDIYRQTRYTLVAETEHSGQRTFFTEKIAKPMLARRLFLVAANPGYLAQLRRLGFRTFHDVLDESYDLEPNLDRRIEMILDQARILEQRDYQEVMQQCRSVLEHNHQHLLNTDWQGQLVSSLAYHLTNVA